MTPYVEMFRHYIDFEGRTSRYDFWIAVLINIVVEGVLNFIGINFLIGLYSLVIFIPYLALSVRRLHDVGKSGFYLFWGLLPLIGWIIVLYQYCKPGMYSSNY